MSYAVAKKRTEPYAKIVEELPQMRRETVQLVRQAVRVGRRAYIIVNNRGEGNAPLTVQALTEMLSKEQGPASFQAGPARSPQNSHGVHGSFTTRLLWLCSHRVF